MNDLPFYDENNGLYDEWPDQADSNENLTPLPEGEIA
jgi:hypothetical protein